MSPSDLKLLIRADAGPNIGTKHVARCIALGKAWKAIGGQTAFACGRLPRSLEKRMVAESFAIYTINNSNCDGTDARETDEVAMAFAPDWVVLDGRRFDDSYLSKLRLSRSRLAVIDDLGYSGYEAADLVSIQNTCSGPTNNFEYSKPQVLIGPEYLLLRDELDSSRTEAIETHIASQARRILVAFDDADPDQITLKVLRALTEIKNANLVVDVVVCASYPNMEDLRGLNKSANMNVRCHRNNDRLSSLIDRADFAVTSGGATCFEFARRGLPMMIVSTSEIQSHNALSIDSLGAAIYVGHHDQFDQDSFWRRLRTVLRNAQVRSQMSQRAKQLVDGQGGSRIIRRLASELFQLRAASLADSKTLHQWRNEPEYRALSFEPQTISIAQHQTWLQKQLNSNETMVWIAEDKHATPIGTIALKLVDVETAMFSICLCPSQRGRGRGPILIEKATHKLLREFEIERVLVQIKPGNTASQIAFKKAGYRPIAPTTVDGVTALQMVFERNGNAAIEEQPSALRISA